MNMHTAVLTQRQDTPVPAAPPIRSRILVALKIRILALEEEYAELAAELEALFALGARLEREMSERHDRIIDLRYAAARAMMRDRGEVAA